MGRPPINYFRLQEAVHNPGNLALFLDPNGLEDPRAETVAVWFPPGGYVPAPNGIISQVVHLEWRGKQWQGFSGIWEIPVNLDPCDAPENNTIVITHVTRRDD